MVSSRYSCASERQSEGRRTGLSRRSPRLLAVWYSPYCWFVPLRRCSPALWSDGHFTCRISRCPRFGAGHRDYDGGRSVTTNFIMQRITLSNSLSSDDIVSDRIKVAPQLNFWRYDNVCDLLFDRCDAVATRGDRIVRCNSRAKLAVEKAWAS